jgi:hypothetical protein
VVKITGINRRTNSVTNIKSTATCSCSFSNFFSLNWLIAVSNFQKLSSLLHSKAFTNDGNIDEFINKSLYNLDMAAADLRNDDFQTNTDNRNLEIFCLIWLDAVQDLKEIKKTERKLRSIINNLKRFQDVKQCQQYIEQTSQKDRLVLVVSGRFGREIVPIIHKYRQIISIYVYCMDRESNEEWSREFVKVKF